MSNPHRIAAEVHKFSINPADPRSLDELESYYRNLSHGSPFARACAEFIAEDTAEVVRYAEEQAEIWAQLAYADKWEQIDAHLESNFPELDDDAREAIVDRVCRG